MQSKDYPPHSQQGLSDISNWRKTSSLNRLSTTRKQKCSARSSLSSYNSVSTFGNDYNVPAAELTPCLTSFSPLKPWQCERIVYCPFSFSLSLSLSHPSFWQCFFPAALSISPAADSRTRATSSTRNRQLPYTKRTRTSSVQENFPPRYYAWLELCA